MPSPDPFYPRWNSMMARCYNTKHEAYPRYGGRGIVVASEWHDFAVFAADMRDTCFAGAELDRIDNEGPYCKANCRWATPSQNQRNRSDTSYIVMRGARLPLPTLMDLGISQTQAHRMFKNYGSDVSTWPTIRSYRGRPARDVYSLLLANIANVI